jgi:hypothetical protein
MREAHASGPLRLLGREGGIRFYEYPTLDLYRCVVAGTAASFFAGGACLNRLPMCGRGFVAVITGSDGAQLDGVCFTSSKLVVVYTVRRPTWTQQAAAHIRLAVENL